jgi:hypothetical protein
MVGSYVTVPQVPVSSASNEYEPPAIVRAFWLDATGPA